MTAEKPPTGNETEQSPDQRQSEREPVFRAADLVLDEKRAPVSCLVQDVSETGLKLIYDSPHELPDYVRIVLLHPRKELSCEVIWRHENEVGLSINPTR
ncbi:MAG: PilZ domain-containing protein [Rhizobiaceae bacterium]